MQDNDWLAQRFEEDRARLTAIASRMLGSASDADDAVQEAWLRLSRSDPEPQQLYATVELGRIRKGCFVGGFAVKVTRPHASQRLIRVEVGNDRAAQRGNEGERVQVVQRDEQSLHAAH